ncbi:MAG: hypothetical protein RI978_1387, partial [Verrucomicrobiota bacterium]
MSGTPWPSTATRGDGVAECASVGRVAFQELMDYLTPALLLAVLGLVTYVA